MVHCALDPAVDYAPVKNVHYHYKHTHRTSPACHFVICYYYFCNFLCHPLCLRFGCGSRTSKNCPLSLQTHTHDQSNMSFNFLNFFAPAATDSDDSGGRQAEELGAGGDGDQAAGRGPARLVPVHRPGPGGGASLHPGGRGGGRPQLPGPPVRPRLPHTGVLHLPVLLSHEQGGLSGVHTMCVLLLLLVGVGRGAGGW